MGEKTTKQTLILTTLAVLAFVVSMSGTVRADPVTDWNVIAITSSTAAGKTGVQQTRIYAMTHAAIHDSLNSIDRRYETYVLDVQGDPGASPAAAVAAAAHGVLVHENPTQQAVLDTAYAAALAAIPDGPSKTNGIAIGQGAAAAILALRSADGSTTVVPYTPGTAPGDWQPTPPAFAPAFLPGWGNVTPFTLRSGDRFRPASPPFFKLFSRKYADEYNEVKSIGSLNSTTRTAEQSEIARFWFETVPIAWNRVTRAVSASHGLDSWENGRLFALLNLAMADSFISVWDAKFAYNFWRPVTAIRAGDTDGNPDTAADPGWNSFLTTPAYPDYTCGHAGVDGTAAEVLARFFGNDEVSFTNTSGPPFPGITRSFSSFSQAAQEGADSRVYAGIHFRAACEDGLLQGKRVGRFVFLHNLKRVR